MFSGTVRGLGCFGAYRTAVLLRCGEEHLHRLRNICQLRLYDSRHGESFYRQTLLDCSECANLCGDASCRCGGTPKGVSCETHINRGRCLVGRLGHRLPGRFYRESVRYRSGKRGYPGHSAGQRSLWKSMPCPQDAPVLSFGIRMRNFCILLKIDFDPQTGGVIPPLENL